MLVQAHRHDAIKIRRGYRAHCSLRSAGDTALLIQNPSLYDTVRPTERNRIDEIELAAGFYERQIHGGCLRIWNDLSHLGDGTIAASGCDLARLVVDDPIADTGLHAAKILARELILFRRAVVVNRI